MASSILQWSKPPLESTLLQITTNSQRFAYKSQWTMTECMQMSEADQHLDIEKYK
jgi:hypothetical protein